MIIQITKGSNERIATNFIEREFFSNSADAPNPHGLDLRLIEAYQIIRNHANDFFDYEIKCRITSTFRTPIDNILKGGAKDSPHKKNIAADAQFYSYNNPHYDRNFQIWWIGEIASKGKLYHELRKLGISGIGMYEKFIHLDTRTEETHNYFNSSDRYGKLSIWDKSGVTAEAKRDRSVGEGLEAPARTFLAIALMFLIPGFIRLASGRYA